MPDITINGITYTKAVPVHYRASSRVRCPKCGGGDFLFQGVRYENDNGDKAYVFNSAYRFAVPHEHSCGLCHDDIYFNKPLVITTVNDDISIALKDGLDKLL